MNGLQAALNGKLPVMIEFYATWCPHCQRMMPIVAELRDSLDGKAEIYQIDGDENPGLMQEFGVNGYPTFIVFKNGEEVWRQSGEMPYEELERHLV